MTEYNGLQFYAACLTAENGFSITLKMEKDKTYLGVKMCQPYVFLNATEVYSWEKKKTEAKEIKKFSIINETNNIISK